MSSDRPKIDSGNVVAEKPGWFSLNNCLFFFIFYSIAILFGARQIWFWKQSPLDIIVPFAFGLCLAIWGLEDVRRRKYKIPSNSKPYFFLFGLIVVPGYVLWSRGWKGLGWIALHAFCWLLLVVITQQIGGIVLFGDKWWQKVIEHQSAN